MSTAIGANRKDENCFAHPSSRGARIRRRTGRTRREIADQGVGHASCIELKESRLLWGLLLGSGESPFAQLTERHFAAHGFTVGLAGVLDREAARLPVDLIVDGDLVAFDGTGYLRLA